MSYLIHGVTLALAWFLAIGVTLSMMVVLVGARARRAASSLLALRLLPAAASIAFVGGAFVPSYWRFEPRDFTEGFDVTLTVLAALGACLLLTTSARGAVAWWRTARRAHALTRTGEPLALGVPVPAYRIDVSEPVLALVGVFRPRLLVTRGLIEALTPEELAASVAHEIGHYHAWDNLKRLAMCAAPDILGWTATARVLERKWAAASERLADAGASIAPSRETRLALASALVKVAHLMPTATTPVTEPVSTLVGGGEIAARVQRLLDEDGPGGPGDPGDAEAGADRRTVARPVAAIAAIAGGLLLAVGYAPLLEAVHGVTEILVHRLP